MKDGEPSPNLVMTFSTLETCSPDSWLLIGLPKVEDKLRKQEILGLTILVKP